MPTKVSIFGQPEVKESKLKPIEFVKVINAYGVTITPSYTPNMFYEVQLRQKNYLGGNYDLIYAWQNPDNIFVYLGHWNDGVVE